MGRSCMYSAYERYLLKSTRHILTSAQSIRDCDSFTKSNQVYSTRYDKMLVQPKCFSFNHGIYSWGRYEGARLWNSLDQHFKEVDSLKDFNVSSRKWQGGGCKCNLCFCVLQRS